MPDRVHASLRRFAAAPPTMGATGRRGRTLEGAGECVTQFHEELAGLSEQMVEMTRLVGSAISRATTALLDADLALAESVIAADEQIDAAADDLEERVARPAGAAAAGRHRPADHRHRAADERRPGAHGRPRPARGQAGPAALPRVGHPAGAARDDARRWARSPSGSWPRPARCIASRDLTLASELETRRRRHGPLHRELFTVLLDDDWNHGIETAVDVTLAAATTSGSPTTRSRWPGGCRTW